jgi:multiple sugar transport system ATP-binding protein
MRTEIIKITEKLGITTIYVTHDQTEAMTMASRIVVMKDGLIQQIGSPKDIYDYPNNKFVGGFIGTPPMNFIEGKITEDGYFVCGNHKVGEHKIKIPANKFKMLEDQHYIEKDIILGIRPEDIHDENVVANAYPDAKLKLVVEVSELLGAETLIHVTISGQPIVAKVNARVDVHMRDEIELTFDMNKCHFFDPNTDLRIVR